MREIAGDKVIISTGSGNLELPSLPLDHKRIIDSSDALELDYVPSSMLVVGGGIIGCEMASIFHSLGSRVTIVEGMERILPLPFIRESSLPHEILHNWWGNGVYVAPDSGNWAEGLATYGADYRIAAEQSQQAARTLRRRWLEDYASYHGGGPAPALRHFRGRVDGESRTVGYNKAAFLWIMLRDRLGAETFRTALRTFYADHRFSPASWSDLQRAFTDTSGEELEGFFAQWLDRRDAPRLELGPVRRQGSRLRLTLRQGSPAYVLDLPIHLTFADGSQRQVEVRFHKPEQTFTVDMAGKRLHALEVDPGVRVFRRLAPGEVPPRLAEVLDRGAEAGIRLEASRDTEAWRRAARKLGRGLWGEEPALDPDHAPAAVRVVSHEALHRTWQTVDGLRALPLPPGENADRVLVGRSGPKAEPVLVIAVDDPRSLAALARPLPHYGSYGWLAFQDSRNVGKGRWPPPDRVLRWEAATSPESGPPGRH